MNLRMLPLLAAAAALAGPGAAAAAPGELDLSFAADGYTSFGAGAAADLLVDPEGRTVIALENRGKLRVARLLPGGAPDPGFNSPGAPPGVAELDISSVNQFEAAEALARQPDGKLLVGGVYNERFALARFNTDGTPDTTFKDSSALTPLGSVVTDLPSGVSGESIHALLVEPDGEIVAAGGLYDEQGNRKLAMVRYRPGGALDVLDFNDGDGATPLGTAVHDLPGGAENVEDIVRDPTDGSFVIAGSSQTAEASQFLAARVGVGGALRTAFGGGDGTFTLNAGAPSLDDGSFAVHRREDGRLVLAGGIDVTVGSGDTGLVGLTAQGAPDPAFGQGGVRRVSLAPVDIAGDIVAQPDGRLLVAGAAGETLTTANVLVARFTPDGALDDRFGKGGFATRSLSPGTDMGMNVALQGEKPIVAGVSSNADNSTNFVARFEGGDNPVVDGGGDQTPDEPTPPTGEPTAPAGGPGAPAGGSGGTATPPAVDPAGSAARPALALSRAKVVRRRGRVSVRFVLSGAATVRVDVARSVKRGRRTRQVRVGGVTRALTAGSRTIALGGALAAKLRRPGRYRVTLTAVDAAGTRSAAVRATLRVR